MDRRDYRFDGSRAGALGGERAALEMLVRGAVVPLGEGRALARLSLAGGRAAACDPAVERSRLELLLDEADRGADPLGDRPGHLRLRRDREVAANVLEQGPVGLREVMRIC